MPSRRISTRARVGFVVPLLVLAAGACQPAVAVREWGEVSLEGQRVSVSSPNELEIAGPCTGDPTVTIVDEDEHQVGVLVEANRVVNGAPEPDCATLLVVDLAEPLGDRSVVDLHSGATWP
ncbi:MAG TPA: hypothetical protein VK906_08525 [Egicoccus sp.]|nr:hypothetical protein [Egicoccus sp.]HSK23206.1 hypothetical protein [Egicoccus sp.]